MDRHADRSTLRVSGGDEGRAEHRLTGAKRIGFLFAGGSMRCIFQVGVVQTLFSLGITPTACLGVSGGAWNAAAVAAGNWQRLRAYWRFFSRMPYIDIFNLFRDHSPFIWTKLHERSFRRYVGEDGIRTGLPLYIAVTRLRDRAQVIFDTRAADDPFRILLASNYLPPFYTHAQIIEGERYGDGGFSNNIPYETLFERGCDFVVLMTSKGESEGGLMRNADDCDHVIPEEYRDRVMVIRPRHRLPLGFLERRWKRLEAIADLGVLRAREVILGERHPQTDLAARGLAPSFYLNRIRRMLVSFRAAKHAPSEVEGTARNPPQYRL